ncbi:MAG: U32 family peptidase, partial [Negativicutes bacterium]|nr:U32 family peptidase [Negativicutes bacterium]
MLLKPDSVELLAPVGTWEVLETAISAGADAVYLGGKRFNMRMHRTDVNFDDIMLERAIKYAHKNKAKLYVTVNNLISDRELDKMRDYLKLLDRIRPDGLIVQDLAILELARELDLAVPLHASVMMNTHNEYSIKSLQEYGITRVVTSREMSLDQLKMLKERTGIEIEYFIHGDMCVGQSGQCLHSGILFGQSSNRGRCLKPCRWPYELIDADTGAIINSNDPGPYKLALKDMCLYRNLPELIQAGVCSFKIEGRMRTADFVKKIVSVYRRAIDRYITDPTGYVTNAHDWQEMYQSRSRDFTTCYALGNPGASAIGYTGEREPRSFSQAVQEAGMNSQITLPVTSENPAYKVSPVLAVRVADLAGLNAACENGANIIYVGGEAFKPYKPWTMRDIATAIATAQKHNVQVIVTTPRITMDRELGEYEQLFTNIDNLNPHGIMVSNIGMLRLARQTSAQPLQTDFSLNVFNHLTVQWLEANGAKKATISPEATYNQITDL